MDHDSLVALRQHHPAWLLLRADNAPLVATVLHRIFVAENTRTISRTELAEALDDELHRLRQLDPAAYPKDAQAYLADWSAAERGWLRKFYPENSDVPYYDLTPAAEKALAWLASLGERSFVGTESRLMTMYSLLQQMVEGTQADPAERIRTLEQRRDAIDAEIERARAGDLEMLDDTALRDRYQQFTATARALLSDFREVEDNFRLLDRTVREKIAGWQGPRGQLLDQVLGERDAISDSDQGVSFAAFWNFLMSAQRQDDFDRMLDRVLAQPALRGADQQMRYVVSDWLKAGDAVQRTVAHLSRQLRRFLDDQAYLQNRRIAELAREIEAGALTLRDDHPPGPFTVLPGVRADISMPMTRPLHDVSDPVDLVDVEVVEAEEDVELDALFNYFMVDTTRLRAAIDESLQAADQVTLRGVIDTHGLPQGLAELVNYLKIADDDPRGAFVDDATEAITWDSDDGQVGAEIPTVIFMRSGDG
ncbi:MAG TPA: DUF3375 domain-containing protein [Actinomycetota bacterium]|nr:DUF3375 domain-containing protein [Actinomycetota bacterium]